MRRKKAKRVCLSSINELLLHCKLTAQKYSMAEVARTGGGEIGDNGGGSDLRQHKQAPPCL